MHRTLFTSVFLLTFSTFLNARQPGWTDTQGDQRNNIASPASAAIATTAPAPLPPMTLAAKPSAPPPVPTPATTVDPFDAVKAPDPKPIAAGPAMPAAPVTPIKGTAGKWCDVTLSKDGTNKVLVYDMNGRACRDVTAVTLWFPLAAGSEPMARINVTRSILGTEKTFKFDWPIRNIETLESAKFQEKINAALEAE